MCIRDSLGIGEQFLLDPQVVLGGLAAGTGAGDRVEDDVAPVSYTHLRAHETVLDLVCRLLLEKKTRRGTLTILAVYKQHTTNYMTAIRHDRD